MKDNKIDNKAAKRALKAVEKEKTALKRKLVSGTFKKTSFLVVVIAIFLLVLCGGAYVLFKPYTITMDLNDGTGTVFTENYNIGSGKIALGTPVRKGYRFTGWTGSNGKKAKTNVTVGNGKIGNLKYTANWSNKLNVRCEDWVIDSDGNMIEEITSKVDKFLKSGKSSKKYKVSDRTIQIKSGKSVRGSKWGKDKSYKAYHTDYVYVGDSGKVKVTENGLVVYRYFYPVIDINFLLDGKTPKNSNVKASTLGTVNLYVNDVLKAENVSDYTGGIPYGATYRLEANLVYAGYKHVVSTTDTGTATVARNNVNFDFETLQGDLTVSCEDWIVDAKGNRIRNITGLVDAYLMKGSSSKKYIYRKRTINVSAGETVNGECWGKDESYKAYHTDFVYAGSSGDVVVTQSGEKVYRYFYPVLDLGGIVRGTESGNLSKYAKANVYVDNELKAEYVDDFTQGVPYGSQYRIEITGYTNFSYVHVPKETDKGIMGDQRSRVYLEFKKRTGTTFVTVEDWVVDKSGNRLKNITNEVDKYLKKGSSANGYKAQDRKIFLNVGDTINPALFGNDKGLKAYSNHYVYAGASKTVTVSTGGEVIYRYFYPVLDVNALVDHKKKNTSVDVATFSVYVDGKLVEESVDVTDFYMGLPAGTRYEIRDIKTIDDYNYVDDGSYTGVMDEDYRVVYLVFSSDEYLETLEEAAEAAATEGSSGEADTGENGEGLDEENATTDSSNDLIDESDDIDDIDDFDDMDELEDIDDAEPVETPGTTPGATPGTTPAVTPAADPDDEDFDDDEDFEDDDSEDEDFEDSDDDVF